MAKHDLYRPVAEKLRAASNVALLVHNSTDGDTLGSALALAIALRKMGKRAAVLAEEKIPDNLSMLPSDGYVRQYGGGGGSGGANGVDSVGGGDGSGGMDGGVGAGGGLAGEANGGGGGGERIAGPAGAAEPADPAGAGARAAGADRGSDGPWDTVVVMDTGDTSRLGKRAALLGNGACVVNIDHHITNQGYGDVNLVVSDAAATAEIVYGLLRSMGAAIDRDIALCIYAGICTDTGGFSYNNTTSGCHEIAAELLKFGLDVNKMHYQFFNAISCGKLRCHGYVANSLKFHYGGRLAVAVIPDSALEALGAAESDCEGLVDIGRNVTGVEVSALAREVKPGEFRVNLRARNDVDVSVIATRFGGGGHMAAAGCTIRARAEDVEGTIVGAMSYAFG
ncbi:MAG: DHH family phosphoesterase [Clostridiales bacterium]|jgi:phosphoesterase RecJ-like protein|nr:DHH family phosphoesterase [Clostridiales bacterium]